MAEKVTLSKKERLSVALRSTFLQVSWNYERMQNGGWAISIIPAIRRPFRRITAESHKRCIYPRYVYPWITGSAMGIHQFPAGSI